MIAERPTVPWYRVPQVWLVIGLPAAVVIGCLITMVIAWRNFDGVVVDDYYRRGLEINRDLARDRRALALGLSAAISVDSKELVVTLGAPPDAAALPEQVGVQLLHATRAGLDIEMVLPEIEPGRYRGPVPTLAAGRWHVRILAADWVIREVFLAQ